MNIFPDPMIPASAPFTLRVGGTPFAGFPADAQIGVQTRALEDGVTETALTGRIAPGLTLRFELRRYADFPAAEYLAFLTNDGDTDSPLIERFGMTAGFPCEAPVLVHGNGETCDETGYSTFRTALDAPMTLSPGGGTSCRGAFPYMRLISGETVYTVAIGWPAHWQAEFTPEDGRTRLFAGQARLRTVLRPGETLRSPRLTLLTYEGDETGSANQWRRWYIRHILPRRNGQPLKPLCCMHNHGADGKPEHTGATVKNQIDAVDIYRNNGIYPDVWWVDAGWYPCNYVWEHTGTWRPDPARFPNGLGPLGEKCEQTDMDFLLWFEPERVREGTELWEKHPEWLLSAKDRDGNEAVNRLLDLSGKVCCDALIEHVDKVIRESRVTVYRQDFNFDPEPYWVQNEPAGRTGATENFHVQGYLRYWDALRERHPGLLIDSCAGGGRRNDLETMRRAVPLHYTDIGYGNHPLKWKQHRVMFEWIPYFRAHNTNWLEEDGTYSQAWHAPDRFSYFAAMTPALTDTTRYTAEPEAFALAREMQPVWRRAAELMLTGDFYPLTEMNGGAACFEAMQFHEPDAGKGFFEILNHARNAATAFTPRLRALDPDAMYRLTDALTGKTIDLNGSFLIEGVPFELPEHTAKLFFYEKMPDA